ncbi:MAG: domain S-box protein [Chitinophagaceae bacterium]|nr:domain S-box protein [Chitinophagaceae bacterium]
MNPDKVLKSFIEVSHVEFNLYDFKRGKFIFTSGIAERLLGYRHEQWQIITDHKLKEIIHPEDSGKLEEYIDRVIHSRSGEIVEAILRYRKASGDYISVYTRKLVTKRDKEGALVEIVTIAEDVTRVIEIEKALTEKVEQLRTISYKNSHEIRSPVTNIMALINLAKDENLVSAELKEIFDLMSRTVEKLDSIIHDINAISNELT